MLPGPRCGPGRSSARTCRIVLVLVVTAPRPASAIDPGETISPELVLVSPDLREFALANAPTFPTAKPFRTPAPQAREPHRPEKQAIRSGPGRKFVVGATAIIVVTVIAVASILKGEGQGQRESSPLRREAARTTDAHPEAGVTASRRRATRRSEARAGRTQARSHGNIAPSSSTKRRGREAAAAGRLKIEAERNVLRSPRFFLENGGAGSIVDRATGVFRANTTVRCSRAVQQASTLLCRIRRGRVVLRFRYIALGRKSFRLAPG